MTTKGGGWNPQPATVALVFAARGVVKAGRAEGYAYTLRGIYYRLVAQNLIPNTQRSYKRLSAALDRARWEGLLDMSAIVDPTRETRTVAAWRDPGHLVREAAEQYRTDWWEGSDPRVEVWAEKSAVAPILAPVAREYGVPFLALRGFPSLTALSEASSRAAAAEGGSATVALYFGDHDPSGLEIDAETQTRLDALGGGAVELRRVALTLAQVAEHGLPPQPAKKTDSRTASYPYAESWELDALPPAVLAGLAREAITPLLPGDWDERLAADEEARARLRALADVA